MSEWWARTVEDFASTHFAALRMAAYPDDVRGALQRSLLLYRQRLVEAWRRLKRAGQADHAWELYKTIRRLERNYVHGMGAPTNVRDLRRRSILLGHVPDPDRPLGKFIVRPDGGLKGRRWKRPLPARTGYWALRKLGLIPLHQRFRGQRAR